MAPASSGLVSGPPVGPSRALDPSASTLLPAESAWVSRQVRIMADAWVMGQPLTAADLLREHPELATEAAVRLIYEEICLRREAGQKVSTQEVINRYPKWKDELEFLLGCDRLLLPFTRPSSFPEVGEKIGPFQLLFELGQGASGKTYVAAEPALAGRLVVLKVISQDQDEHLSLARLQHTHIIPLFSEHPFPDLGLRALCMPYLGGASLARLLEAMVSTPPALRRGRHILAALDRIQAELPAAVLAAASDEGPYRRYLEQASYIQAVCWIAACLADALHEAHAHSLIHMDVKPSNVLIAADGQPMLLDFHLARRSITAGERVADRLGGTPGWMAPEQAEALKAVGQGQPVPKPVDQRADLYTLGLLLCESLCGPGAAADAVAGKPWRHRNTEVSVGLVDIIEKCLATLSPRRYRDAATLAEDLRRHGHDLPLRGVPNRSLLERWSKWRRRQPGALARNTSLILAVVAVGAALVLASLFHRQRILEVQTALEDGQRLRGDHRYPESIRVLVRGLEHAGSFPQIARLAGPITQELHLARRGQKAVELHELADIIRFRYGSAAPPSSRAWQLVNDIRAVWNGRGSLLGEDAGQLDPDIEQGIQTDLLELVIVWADLRVRLAARADLDQARREAVELLDEAEAVCGPSPALTRERRAYSQVATQAETVAGEPTPQPRSSWEHYALGRWLLRAGDVSRAAKEFSRSIEMRPQDFWPHFYQGLCAYRLGEYEEAAAAFRTCIALSPGKAECFYNRALCYEALSRGPKAQDDYTRALEIDPSLSAAALNRGTLAYHSRRYDEAISDFERVLRTGPDPETAARTHFNLALAYRAKGDNVAAAASADEAVSLGHKQARELRDAIRRNR